MEVKCLCWNCGKEILSAEPIHKVDEELWCENCYTSCFNDKPDYNYDEESM